MTAHIDPAWVLAAIAIISGTFALYRYFKDPQEATDKAGALMAQDIKAIREDITNIRDNHIHSLQNSLNDTNKNVNNLTVQVATLATIIDERIPKK